MPTSVKESSASINVFDSKTDQKYQWKYQSTYPPPCYSMSEQSQVHQPIQSMSKQQVKCSTGEARDRDRNFIKFRYS